MEEKYIMENVLTLTKSSIVLCLNGAIEASNERVLKLFKNSLNTLLSLQEELYNVLVNKSIYFIKNAKSSDIAKLLTKLKK